MTVSYSPGGVAIVESYEFIARDMYISNGNLRNTDKSVMSSVDSTGARSTQQNRAPGPMPPQELRRLRDLVE
jgi:hypothetical protein